MELLEKFVILFLDQKNKWKILKNKKILGIIGIRSGSKGVPDKNIRELSGKPLVGWIIEKAKKSKYINRLVVSTDSEIYAEIAKIFMLKYLV